jgi:hypothetical protein
MTLFILEHRKFNWYQGAPDRCTLMAVEFKNSPMAINDKLKRVGALEQQQDLETIRP